MAKSKDLSEELIKIRREIVDFHGEMVLLENYSALNYTGTLFSYFSLAYYIYMYVYVCACVGGVISLTGINFHSRTFIISKEISQKRDHCQENLSYWWSALFG